MTLNDFLGVTCPSDCDTDVQLPAIADEQNCTTYDITLSQVRDLYIIPTGATFPMDWAGGTAVAGAIDNSVTDNTKTKHLVGIGGVAEPEETIDQYPDGKTRVTKADYSLVMRILQLDDQNYEFLRAMQCGWTGFTILYGDRADKIFGKDGGIVIKSVRVVFPKGDGEDDRNHAVITIVWEAKGDPERKTNPL